MLYKSTIKSAWWCLSFQKVSEAVGKTPLPELTDMFSKQGITPNSQRAEEERNPQIRKYRTPVAGVSGIMKMKVTGFIAQYF
jgi:hypothetical protein